MAEQESPHYVTRVSCSNCGKTLKSHKPIRVGHTMIRCPRCGHKFLVEAAPAKTPSRFPHPPVGAPETPRVATGPTGMRWGTLQPGEARASAPDPGHALPSRLPEVAGYKILGEL